MTTTLVNLYDALTAAGAPQDKARAAVQSVEESQDEPWKRRIEGRLARLEMGQTITIAMLVGLLVKAFFWGDAN